MACDKSTLAQELKCGELSTLGKLMCAGVFVNYASLQCKSKSTFIQEGAATLLMYIDKAEKSG